MHAFGLGSGAELFLDRRVVWSNIVQTPEVEATHLVCVELFGQRNRALHNLILLAEGSLDGAVHIAFRAIRPGRRARPISFQEPAGDVGHAQMEYGEYLQSFVNLSGAQFSDILAPHGAQLDPAHAEIMNDNETGGPSPSRSHR